MKQRLIKILRAVLISYAAISVVSITVLFASFVNPGLFILTRGGIAAVFDTVNEAKDVCAEMEKKDGVAKVDQE